ncbi:Lish Domain-Containing Protein Armc9 [Manis pentadactyla]|nr:Lish Domain-Containing Protein Armc9 [Manis pentadactyla]
MNLISYTIGLKWRNSSSPGEARELASERPLSRTCCQMCSSSSPEMLQMLHADSPGLVPSVNACRGQNPFPAHSQDYRSSSGFLPQIH